MTATDNAMKVTVTDAVQVLGAAGYDQGLPGRAVHARRRPGCRSSKGTNQIQRLVISRDLARP